jgi:hypothetical protein
MNPPFGHTLIVGAGPAAIHTAVNMSKGWCGRLGLVNRRGSHTDRLMLELEQSNQRLISRQSEAHTHLSGEARVDHFYAGFDELDDIWQTIILCTPSDSYKDIIHALKLDSLTQVRTIILISPSIGSNLLVSSQLKKAKATIDVISLSTYYAATKFESGPNAGMVSCFTKALKKRIYAASCRTDSIAVGDVQRFIESLGIQCMVVDSTIEAESRSITTYVHPPLFINDFSLQQIFSSEVSKKSMYKLYPEGPITGHAIRAMVLLWKEISGLIRYFGAEPINLLKFLNDDNYPVHEITLSRGDIESFTRLEPIQQEYLLYIRYSAILIDPFSIPDERGSYFDFSAVPYKQVHQDQQGRWFLPRIPYEDYKRLKLMYGLAQKVDIPMPQTLELIKTYERSLNDFVEKKGREFLDTAIFIDTTDEDVEAIVNEMGRQQ